MKLRSWVTGLSVIDSENISDYLHVKNLEDRIYQMMKALIIQHLKLKITILHKMEQMKEFL